MGRSGAAIMRGRILTTHATDLHAQNQRSKRETVVRLWTWPPREFHELPGSKRVSAVQAQRRKAYSMMNAIVENRRTEYKMSLLASCVARSVSSMTEVRLLNISPHL